MVFKPPVLGDVHAAALNPEAYLIDIIARLPDHPMKRIAELLPHAWKNARSVAPAATVAVPTPIPVVV